MPNHVINKVTISGKKSEIAKCKNQIITTTENGVLDFSFQSIIPRPKSLDIESSSSVDDAMEFILSRGQKNKEYFGKLDKDELERILNLGRTALKNIALYGFKDWHKWSIRNWGTKWDCYEVSVDVFPDTISMEFQTAWNSPQPVFKKLAELFPSLEIEVLYADEDLGSNCGSYTYLDGDLTETYGDYKFACELWGYDPEDEEEDEED